MLRQCGAVATNSLDETIDVMKMLLNSKLPQGPRMALLAQTGGQSVSITDAFGKAGLEIPRFTDDTYAQLGEFFNIVGGSYQNPLDMAGTIQGNMETLDRILRIIDADANVDAITMELSAMFAARQWKSKPETLEATLETLSAHMARSQKAFSTVLHPAHEAEYVASISPLFHARHIPLFQSFERAADAMARALAYAQR
jgi:acyl-CoA synthetase (NDP forming)